jgi:hypothetical protein
MDVDSVNKWDPDREKAVNISESDWDEYDPLWIK